MIIRNSKFKQIIPDNFTYKGTKYTKAYHKGEILFAYTDDDYAYQYFTIESLEDGNVITFSIPAAITTSELTSMSYSSDDGSTWNTTTVDGTAKTISVNLDKGSKVLWKGIGTRTSTSSSSCSFSSTKTYNTYGNLKSLLLNDNFYNNTTSTSTTNKYRNLFKNSTGLVDAHNLMIDNTFGNYQYYGFFRGCSNLMYSPKLSSESLTVQCYQEMFAYCSSLVEAPELPATTLKANCYREMFYGCTSLVKVPELPATTMVTGCYLGMFYNCSGLIEAPELPATTLNENCYQSMFQNCTSLVIPPELPATTLSENCYYQMFYGCSNLNYIKCLATDISASNCTTSWVSYVAATGTFIKADNMSSWVIDSVNGIPIGWTLHNYENCTVTLTVNDSSYGRVDGAGTYHTGELVTIKANRIDGYRFVGWYDGNTLVSENEAYTFQIWTDVSYQAVFESGQVDYSTQYFTIESLEDGNFPMTSIFPNGSYDFSVYYKKVGVDTTWKELVYNRRNVELNIGDKIIIKSNTSTWNECYKINCSKKYKVYGNIMSLLYGDDFQNNTSFTTDKVFSKLFYNETNLTDASNLILPATTLTSRCYYMMFYNCTHLKTAPELPATTLADSCYMYMFDSCISLTSTPQLPATTLTNCCYYGMFRVCYELTTAPQLPSTTLAQYCYWKMFEDCIKLTSAPILPATTLRPSCYENMFSNTEITSIKIYAISTSYNINFGTSLPSRGTYYVKRNAGSTILNACPTGWTISKTL